MLEVSHVKKYFISGEHTVKAVDDISFTVDSGKFMTILGKSGSGKSTLLSLLGALDVPSEGTIVVDGQDITKLSDHALTTYRRTHIGFVFQSYNLVPNLTALENVMLPMEFAKVPSLVRKQRASELLSSVGLDEVKQQRKPARLSGGEQQRVAIARALANKPKLILADEPTGNLDNQTGTVIVDLLKGLAKSHQTTIIAVTHDHSLTEHADLTVRILDGKVAKK